MYEIMGRIFPESTLVRRIREAFRQTNAVCLYQLVRKNRRMILAGTGTWLKRNDLEGHQALGIARAFEQIYSDGRLIDSLTFGEPTFTATKCVIDEMYLRLGNSPRDALCSADEILINMPNPVTFSQHLLVIDCLGAMTRALFNMGNFIEADKINSKGIDIAVKCLDIISEKSFVYNRIKIRNETKSREGECLEQSARRVAEIERVIHGSL